MTKKMQKIDANSPEAKSADLVAENIARLKALFPELVTEGQNGASVNVDVLKQLVGDQTVTDADEKYGLNWFGKRKARQLALTPSLGTLRPAPEESVDWETTQNLMIEGDNLEVLKLLQKSYAGKVKLIYIDPPYNTGKDFVYPDDFRDGIGNYQKLMGWRNEEGEKVSSLSTNSEASGRFHTDWLNMMHPRLKIARELLRNDGIIFVSIDDNEAHRLRHICDEIFGEENFVAILVWRSGGTASAHFTTEHEYVIAYARDIERLPLFSFSGSADVSDRAIKRPSVKNPTSIIHFPAGLDFESPDQIFPDKFGDAEPVAVVNGTLEARDRKLAHDVEIEAAWSMGDMIQRWLSGEEVVDQKGQRIKRFFFKHNGVLQYEKEKGTIHPKTIIEGISTKSGSQEVETLLGARVFDYPKPVTLIQNIVEWSAGQEGIVLDLFAGSGTTAEAVMRQNFIDSGSRRWILVQMPEPTRGTGQYNNFDTIVAITKARLRGAGKQLKHNKATLSTDVGFRVFKLDSSNLRAWDPDRDNLEKTLLDHAEHVKADRTENDLLYELLLKLGLDLCVPIEKRHGTELDSRLRGNDGLVVHSVGGGVLMACLAADIDRKDVEPLAQGIVDWHKELSLVGETTCVFRDSAFPDEASKANLTAILEQGGITHVRSL